MELEGQWWFPDFPSEIFSGKLRFESGNPPQLDITDNLSINQQISLNEICEESEANIILGKTTDGEKVTFYSSEGVLGDETLFTIFSGDLFLKGIHVESEDEFSFPRLELDIPHTTRWLNKNGFKAEHYAQGQDRYNIEISYMEPEPVEAEIGNLTVSVKFKVEEDDNQPTHFGLEQNSVFHVESEDGLNIDQIKKNVRNLRRFLSFCIGIDVYPTGLMVYKNLKNPEADEVKEFLPDKAELYYPRKRGQEEEISFTNFNTLFGYTTLEEEFENVLNSWYEICDELDNFMDLYFSTRESQEMLLSNNFLNLARAIESYHRGTYSGSYMEKEDYRQEIWPIFKDAIPDDKIQEKVESGEIEQERVDGFKQSLKNETKWGYEYSLRTRMKEIFDDYESRFEEVIEQGRSNFVHEIVSTRNFLTHFSEESEEDSLEIEELVRPTLQLRFITETFLLEELDLLESEKVNEHQNLQIYNRLKHMLRE